MNDSDRQIAARHEAAQAVVAVRRKLPLESTTIVGCRDGRGETKLTASKVRQWEKDLALGPATDLPDTNPVLETLLADAQDRVSRARSGLTKIAVMHAAGLLVFDNQDDKDAIALRIYQLLQEAGFQNRTEIRQGLKDKARADLENDKEAAWGRVTAALLDKETLTGEEVWAIVYPES